MWLQTIDPQLENWNAEMLVPKQHPPKNPWSLPSSTRQVGRWVKADDVRRAMDRELKSIHSEEVGNGVAIQRWVDALKMDFRYPEIEQILLLWSAKTCQNNSFPYFKSISFFYSDGWIWVVDVQEFGF